MLWSRSVERRSETIINSTYCHFLCIITLHTTFVKSYVFCVLSPYMLRLSNHTFSVYYHLTCYVCQIIYVFCVLSPYMLRLSNHIRFLCFITLHATFVKSYTFSVFYHLTCYVCQIIYVFCCSGPGYYFRFVGLLVQ